MSKKSVIRITLSVLICLLVGAVGAIATQTSVSDWYVTLDKPEFNPPNWVFGPVWTVLYILMGIAAGIIWSKGFYHKWVKTALYHFGFQLLLNASWSIVFFGSQSIFPALLILICLFIFLFFTFKWFLIVDQVAAFLLTPYMLWVGFAMVLNFEIWRLNYDGF